MWLNQTHYLGQKHACLILIFSLNIRPPLPWSHQIFFFKFYQDILILFFFFLAWKISKMFCLNTGTGKSLNLAFWPVVKLGLKSMWLVSTCNLWWLPVTLKCLIILGLLTLTFKIFHASAKCHKESGERGGSVVECRTPEREVGGSRPTAAVLCPWARHFTPRKYWLFTQEAVAPSRHDWKIVDWDVKPQHKQT